LGIFLIVYGIVYNKYLKYFKLVSKIFFINWYEVIIILYEKRMDDLSEEIDKQIIRINNDENEELLELIYLFYDGYK